MQGKWCLWHTQQANVAVLGVAIFMVSSLELASEVCELCNKQNEFCNGSGHWMKCDQVSSYNEMSWTDIFDYSTKCNEMKSVV